MLTIVAGLLLQVNAPRLRPFPSASAATLTRCHERQRRPPLLALLLQVNAPVGTSSTLSFRVRCHAVNGTATLSTAVVFACCAAQFLKVVGTRKELELLPVLALSRRRDRHCADTPSLSLLKRLPEERGGVQQ